MLTNNCLMITFKLSILGCIHELWEKEDIEEEEKVRKWMGLKSFSHLYWGV